MLGMLQRQITEKLQATIAAVPAVALLGARYKYILYGGNDEFPVGKDVKIISLLGLMERLYSG